LVCASITKRQSPAPLGDADYLTLLLSVPSIPLKIKYIWVVLTFYTRYVCRYSPLINIKYALEKVCNTPLRYHDSPPQKVHNYRFSHTRRIIENAFGLLCAKFRVLRAPITLSLPNATSVIKAIVCLHNFLLAEDKPAYLQPGDAAAEDDEHGIIPGRWELDGDLANLFDIERLAGNRTGTTTARSQRDAVAAYFVSREGAVPWQYRLALVDENEIEQPKNA
jgi:hypothetical protein